MIPSRKAILECPKCGKHLVNIASKIERVHPIARAIKNHSLMLFISWAILSVIVIIFLSQYSISMSLARGWLALSLFPPIAMYFIRRMFPLYRVTDCPYCHHHEEMRLGHSSDD